MLELKNIKKDYVTGAITTHALKGVSLNFRQSEFVSILGPSGCGKTTLLNIIGGLDQATSGELLIKGKSTKKYKDRDWDTYRNHSIGFVFQSYNLIAHQTILSNVELALTLSGVKKKERRERAKEVLKRVGLEDNLNKYPNQLSGGQMQRVAIARALVNNPEILLADEPTGALDSTTSTQIMELLKEIANDRLVIMVTHNPQLANKYSTRIITLHDGLITSDTNPYDDVKTLEATVSKKGTKKYASMSFKTALSLSFKNLLSKKGRTFLTAFAGSIGIIGIALILAVSDGFNTYVETIQSDTLSQYPIELNSTETSLTSLVSSIGSVNSTQVSNEEYTDADSLGENTIFSSFFSGFSYSQVENDLASFKTYLESDDFINNYSEYVNAIQYVYDVDFTIYESLTQEEINNGETANKLYPIDYSLLTDSGSISDNTFTSSMISIMNSYSVFNEMIDNQELILSQYDVIAGDFPSNSHEMVLVVDSYNNINDYVLYALGLKDPSELIDLINGENIDAWSGTFDDIVGLSFKMPVGAALYQKNTLLNTWIDISEQTGYEQDVQNIVDDSIEVTIKGILRVKEDNQSGGALSNGVYYLSDLTKELIELTDNTDVVEEQKANPDKCVIYYYQDFPVTISTYSIEYDDVMSVLGVCDLDNPSTIYIYPKSFSDKETLVEMIEIYNSNVDEDQVIHYSDTLSVLMSGITTVVNSVTIVLICFVSISLVVSSIMIAIITYVSVIERTKEIGVLRSLGASKKDVSNVFNAETLIIGLFAGLLGVIACLILIIPVNVIISSLTSISNLAFLSWYWALALIAVSIILTVISGLIPARIASKKDPVVALRSGE